MHLSTEVFPVPTTVTEEIKKEEKHDTKKFYTNIHFLACKSVSMCKCKNMTKFESASKI